MSLSYGKVGISPGTTTLTIGRGGSTTLVGHGLGQQDPVQRAYASLMQLGYFDARPSDFDMSKVYNYMPARRGWISAKLDGAGLGACCSGCAVGTACAGGLGEEVATLKPALTPEQQKAISEFVMSQLELESKSLEIKERRSRRFWGAIAGLSIGTTALVAVLTYMKKV